MSCLPPRLANSSAPPPGTSSKACLRPTAPAPSGCRGTAVTAYIYAYENRDDGDIARQLAEDLRTELRRRTTLTLIDPGQRIRATVIGASQFTVQVSGKTIHLPRPGVLPVRNVPVVPVGLDLGGAIDGSAIAAAIRAGLARLDLAPDARLAIAFSWHGDPDYPRIAATGAAIMAAVAPDGRRRGPLLLLICGDK